MLWEASNESESFEPARGQLGVTHRVLDVFVPEVGPEGAGVVSVHRGKAEMMLKRQHFCL
jgi:hypothetical protein